MSPLMRAGNLLATVSGDLCYLDFGMMSEAPENARFAIIAHVVHLVNRDYEVSHLLGPVPRAATTSLSLFGTSLFCCSKIRSTFSDDNVVR
jgi:hypothetical protein